ncbi:amino acid adenylation domain-containing protein [Brevibacillus laterosporus]|uniref:non-ribosomal peptide synthetase n=1 Tax=Brevibacillus laterosporus TaxID=1465 RepID=UPI002E1E58A3|nr:amino acid adenylation domain-containing protein [Brevibacillus laterosporus]
MHVEAVPSYSLTNAQKRIWFVENIYPNLGATNLATSFTFSMSLQHDILIKAIHQFISENDSIRLTTIFSQSSNNQFPMQIISEDIHPSIPIFDFRFHHQREQAIQEWLSQMTKQPFSFSEGPLYYFAILQKTDTETMLYMKFSHLIADGVAMLYAIKEIVACYQHLARGEEREKQVKPSYIEMLDREREYLGSRRFTSDENYWSSQFEKVPELVSLTNHDGLSRNIASGRHSLFIQNDLRDQIDSFCEKFGISPNIFFLGTFYLYLYRITAKRDIIVGHIISNRSSSRDKHTFGMFASTIPFRHMVNPDADFVTYCLEIAKQQRQMLRHQKYPYQTLLSKVREQHPNVQQLFSIAMEFQVLEFDMHDDLSYTSDIQFSGYEPQELILHIKDRRETKSYQLDFDHHLDIFTEEEIGIWSERYRTLIESALKNPMKCMKELDLLSLEEKTKILVDWNLTEKEYPLEKTFVDLFTEQVSQIPEHHAVEFGEKTLSYLELDELSTGIAHTLRKKAGRENIIAIMLPRSIEMIVSILAVSKAGAAYLPIDPDYPPERIAYMLEDSAASILLTTEELDLSDIDFLGEKIDVLKSIEEIKRASSVNSQLETLCSPHPTDLAYVIYTSGSTGRPKGVMIEHRSLSNLIFATRDLHEISSDTRILQFCSFSFDASVREIIPTLASGGTVCMDTKERLFPGKQLIDWLHEKRINMAVVPTSVMAILPDAELPYLQTLEVGGEVCPVTVAVRWGKGRRFFNSYGPTEATVCSTSGEYVVTNIPEELDKPVPPDIGHPISNSKIFILDENQQPVPVGVIGEVYIGGAGLARGYLNREDLTREKFVYVEFKELGDGAIRLYRTGDLARFLPNGRIAYEGRIDDQVKIRGHRIEIKEIEHVLCEHPVVKQCVTVVEDDEKYGKKLVAYVVLISSDGESSISLTRELRIFLQGKLPFFMIPNAIKILEDIPLNPNGKIDRKKLNCVESNSKDEHTAFVAPITEIESTLTKIWQEALGTEQIGIHDHFFHIGGDSYRLLYAHQEINAIFRRELPVIEMFRYPTIHTLAQRLSQEMSIVPTLTLNREIALKRKEAMQKQKQIRKRGR